MRVLWICLISIVVSSDALLDGASQLERDLSRLDINLVESYNERRVPVLNAPSDMNQDTESDVHALFPFVVMNDVVFLV